jgi:hypothetical protein
VESTVHIIIIPAASAGAAATTTKESCDLCSVLG